MSRLEKLVYNPNNYKNLCNVFEADSSSCEGCHWKEGRFKCILPIHDRADLQEILNVTFN